MDNICNLLNVIRFENTYRVTKENVLSNELLEVTSTVLQSGYMHRYGPLSTLLLIKL